MKNLLVREAFGARDQLDILSEDQGVLVLAVLFGGLLRFRDSVDIFLVSFIDFFELFEVGFILARELV